MSKMQTVKKVGKMFGIGFVVLLFIGAVGSSSEDSVTIEHLEKEVQELEQEVQELEDENKALESQKEALNNEIDRLKGTQQEVKPEPEPEPVVEEKPEPEQEEPAEKVEEAVVVNKDIERLQIQEVDSKTEYGILTVTVSLVADKDYQYLDIEIPVYDSEGYLIGSAIGIASDIKAGQKAKVECTSFDAGTYKLEELTVDSF